MSTLSTLIVALLILAGCRPVTPTAEFLAQNEGQAAKTAVEFPAPYEDKGLHVTVDGVYRLGDTLIGVTGIATNQTNRELRHCILDFDVLDPSGAKVGDAVATVNGLKPGQQWRFQAPFTIPFQTVISAVRPNRIAVS